MKKFKLLFVALMLPSSALGQPDAPQSIVDSSLNSGARAAVNGPVLPPIQRPSIGDGGPLSTAEIRWCLSREIGLQAIEPTLGARDAIRRYNELADEFNRRCNARPYSERDHDEAALFIDATRADIVGAAVDDIQQLNDGIRTRRTQEILDSLGYEVTVDGRYGARTKAAIEAFQLKVGFPVDGLLSDDLLTRLQVEDMRRRTGRDTAPIVRVALLVMEASQEAESDARAVANVRVIVSSDRGFYLDQQTDHSGRIELGRLRAGKLDIDVWWNDEQYGSKFQLTDDPLQEIWIPLPAPLPEDLENAADD